MNEAHNWAEVKPVYESTIRELCKRSYIGHIKGCPNYAKKKGCPPTAPLLPDIFNFNQPIYAIWNRFDFGSHCIRMRE